MDEKDWKEWEKIYEAYEDARKAYEHAQAKLRGAFSELARRYEEGTQFEGRRYEEQMAFERFTRARKRLNDFLAVKLKKNDAEN